MKFNVTVTRCVSSSSSQRKTGKLNGSCEPTCRRGRSQSTRGIRKRCKIRAGWRHEWIPRTELPSRTVLAIHEVVRGPFSSPRLVSASPYVLVSSYRKDGEFDACKSATLCPRIKRGIPDPWAEYLAHRGFCSKNDQRIVRRDLELGCKNIYVTAKVWKDLGLPLGQGIPDPWKIPVGKKKWVIERGDKPYSEKRQRHKDRQYCGCCKRCQANTQISIPRSFRQGNKTALNSDQFPPNPLPGQEIKCGEVTLGGALHRFENSTPQTSDNSPKFEPIKKFQECTASCNTHPHGDRPIDDIAKPYLLKQISGPSRGGQPILGKSEQPITNPFPKTRIADGQLDQGIKTPKKLMNSGVQTSETVLVNSNITKIETLSHLCSCAHQQQIPIQHTACACENNDVMKKRVGFQTTNSACAEKLCNLEKANLNQNLNVTQLPCGCVHVSPCINRRAELKAGNGSDGGASSHKNASHGDSCGHKCCECVEKKSHNSKPKMISQMKRLLNKYKSSSGPRHEARGSQTVASDTRVSKIPNEARLVCCQCNCPYLKVGNSAQEVTTEVVAKKKKKCVCTRCIAKRERRERRQNKKATVEEQDVWLSPKCHQKCIRVEHDQRISTNYHEENCTVRYGLCINENLPKGAISPQPPEQKIIAAKEESYSPPAPQRDNKISDDMNRSCEVTEKFSADVNSLEEWQHPSVFGEPWYTSDSGENADISEVSRHTVQCTSMLKTGTAMPLVTSCTFINRIDHNTVFQCMKRQQKIPKRGDRLKASHQDPQETPESESYASRKCLQRTNSSQTPSLTNGNFNPKTIPILKQIPLLDIEELKTRNTEVALPRIVCIDTPVGCVSCSEGDETSRMTNLTDGNEKREDILIKCPSSRKKQSRKKLNTPTSKTSQVHVDSETISNRLERSPFEQIHLASPKTRLVEENEDLTGVDNNKLTLIDSDRDMQALENSVSSNHILSSSNSTHSLCHRAKNFEHEPVITSIVSPRKMSTNSSMSWRPESFTEKSRKLQVSRNTPIDGASSKDPASHASIQNAIIHRYESPSMQSPCFAKNLVLSNNTPKSQNSTPCRFAICSPAKVNGFFEGEGEGMGSFDLDITEKTEDETTQEFLEEVRTLVPNTFYQGGKNSSADNKCYLKYCNLRRSGPCIISPSSNALDIQRSSYLSNQNGEDDVPGMAEKEFPLGRRAFSSTSRQKNPVLPFGDPFARVSMQPVTEVQDKFNVG